MLQSDRMSDRWRIVFKRAMEFIEFLKRRLGEGYVGLVNFMRDLPIGRLDKQRVVVVARNAFADHSDLIWCWNGLMPEYIKIPIDKHTEENAGIELQAAFILKVEDRLQGGEVFESFMRIIFRYVDEIEAYEGAFDEVSELLHEHQDLVIEFAHVFPWMCPLYPAICHNPLGEVDVERGSDQAGGDFRVATDYTAEEFLRRTTNDELIFLNYVRDMLDYLKTGVWRFMEECEQGRFCRGVYALELSKLSHSLLDLTSRMCYLAGYDPVPPPLSPKEMRAIEFEKVVFLLIQVQAIGGKVTERFFKILRDHCEGRKIIEDVYREVFELLQNRQDLQHWIDLNFPWMGTWNYT